MNIQESIKKIIKEETQNIEERTKLEKSVKYFVDELLENYKLPENFYGSGFYIRWSTATVDSYNDSYEKYYKPQK